jgi:hypothetical protein
MSTATPGDICIVNDFDRPCCEMLARVISVAYSTMPPHLYQLRYLVGDKKSMICQSENPTPVSDFGVKVVIDNGKITAIQFDESTATYENGTHRSWQATYRSETRPLADWRAK